MNYYYDTEFLEGTQKKWFGNTKPTIDLISIGIVAEDGREYYAISKDFNLKEAWNRYDEVLNKLPAHDPTVESEVLRARHTAGYKKVYWIRENVLKPIYTDLLIKDYSKKLFISEGTSEYRRLEEMFYDSKIHTFTLNNFKRLLFKYGKSNKQIAEEVQMFCLTSPHSRLQYQNGFKKNDLVNQTQPDPGFTLEFSMAHRDPIFYGYYADYDWVAFCWLFGKMIDLPKGFPMYSKDLKQTLDEKANNLIDKVCYESGNHTVWTLNEAIANIKLYYDYPKQTNEHNALADAKWNKDLHNFLSKL